MPTIYTFLTASYLLHISFPEMSLIALGYTGYTYQSYTLYCHCKLKTTELQSILSNVKISSKRNKRLKNH